MWIKTSLIHYKHTEIGKQYTFLKVFYFFGISAFQNLHRREQKMAFKMLVVQIKNSQRSILELISLIDNRSVGLEKLILSEVKAEVHHSVRNSV